MSEIVHPTDGGGDVCQYCLSPITKFDSFQNLVCIKCYRRLIRGGLTDKEIFEPKEPDKDIDPSGNK